MSVRPSAVPRYRLLAGSEGELVQLRLNTDPRQLEDLLDCLAGVPFPINPTIYHGRPTIVEFPAYEGRLHQVRGALHAYGFDQDSIEINGMLEAMS